MTVACGEGALQLITVQPDGKPRMAAADWLRGGMKSNVNDHIDRLGRLLEGNIRQALERSCR